MAPPKKRRKRKGGNPAFRGGVGGDLTVPGEFDHEPDKITKNKGGCSRFCSGLVAMGFDPYVEIKHYPSQIKHSTNPVYNAKRAVEWTEEDKNTMLFSFDKSEIENSILSVALYDYEFGEDPQIGQTLIKLDEVVSKVGDTKKDEYSIKRNGVYTGSLTMEMTLKQEASENVTLEIKVIRGDHLKKERETDVATDSSTMSWICFGFVSYLAIVGIIFSLLEKGMGSTEVGVCMSSPTHAYANGEVYQVKCGVVPLAGDATTESPVDPNDCCNRSPVIVSWFDGFWFAFVTATTVGYGDYYPLTIAGRYVNSVIITVDVLFMGFAIGMIVDFIAAAAERANERKQRNSAETSEDENLENFKKSKSQVDVLDNEEQEQMQEDMEEEADDAKTARDEAEHYSRMFMWDLVIYSCLEISLIFGGSVFFYYDQKAHGSPWTYSQALHFCFVTTSTVGYGDIAPTSDGAKLFCLFYNLLSIGFLVKLGGLACDKLVEGQQKKIAQKKADESLMHWEQIAEFDVEGDGELDLYEFTRAMLKATGKVSFYDLEQIETRFDSIDRDGSGYITKEDFALLAKERAEQEATALALKKKKEGGNELLH